MAKKKIETIISERIRPFSLNEKGRADVASNIVANILTNPMKWGGL